MNRLRKSFGIVSSVLLLGLVAATPEAQAVESVCKNPQFFIGAGTHMGQNKLDSSRASTFFAHTKVNSFRDEFYWHRLERERGVLKIPDNLADLDTFVRNHAPSKGPLPLIPLNYASKFYDGGDLPRSAEAIAAYAKYAEFVARTYSAAEPIFEIWNEWNAGFGSAITPRKKGSAEDYVKLMQGAIPLIRKASPKSLVLGGATGNIDLNWSLDFVRLGGLKWVDGFSIHPYNYKHWARRTSEDAVDGLIGLQDRMSRAAGVSAIPFYLTEMGIPSSTSKSGHSEDAVATYTARFLLLARAQPFICGVWWYELFDSGDRDDEDEHRFGLFRRNGTAKPAADIIAQLADFLKNGSGFTPKREGNIQSVTWRMPDGSEYLAYWAIKGNDTLSLDLSKYSRVALAFDVEPEKSSKRAASSGLLDLGTQPQIFKRLKP